MTRPHSIVVGAGVFGVSAARELRRRGHAVTLMDAGPLPHPLAASTDVSKVIRMEYGADERYTALAEAAREGWIRWNADWERAGAEPLFHETGVLMVSLAPMQPGGFEHDSYAVLRRRGHRPDRLDGPALAERFPAWSTRCYVDGFYHRAGGFAQSGRVVEFLIHRAAAEGIRVLEEGRVASLIERHGRVTGVRRTSGSIHRADHVVVAAGSWTGKLLGLGDHLRATGHPVFHVRPADPALFHPKRFPTFTADIAKTGYYGFPLHPREGVVKIGKHGRGIPLDPDAPRVVPDGENERLREFFRDTFPALVDADVVFTRLCPYADTQDGDFWIARVPERRGLTVATGGSGHGFKFAPILGPLIADAVEGRDNPWLREFRWRPEVRLDRGRERARAYHIRAEPPAT